MVAAGYIHERFHEAKSIKSIVYAAGGRAYQQHVNSSVDECCFTQLQAETKYVDKKEVPLASSRSSSDATEQSEKWQKR